MRLRRKPLIITTVAFSTIPVVAALVSGNNVGHLEAPNTAGVVTFAAPGAVNHRTKIWDNDISNQFYGVWSRGDFPPKVFDNDIDVTAGGTPTSLG
jgi:hypothetical protein